VLAQKLGLPVLQPERARSEEFVAALRELGPELIAVAAYGQILPPAVLDLPRHGCVNVHTSLLPRYRGAARIQWALINGDTETGVTIMKMDEGLDTGDILTQERTEIRPEDNSQTLHDRLASMGADLLVRTIPDYVAGKISPRPQRPEQATHAPKIKKQDGRIDWNQPARVIWNRFRGLLPWPGVFTTLPAEPQPAMLKIWEAEPSPESGAPGTVLQSSKNGIVVGCGNDALLIKSIQPENGRRMSAQEFLAGHPLPTGTRFV
jgi:methionyl-tRNA formyltransferase